ncbi:hypothetical protein ACFPA1_25135 [Neobacillus sp. GCM10023253]|uniref:hypothetical protein n=1 Tax=Neobacillus sp. GCM10023253 TaxID=3252644 RepID=UPI003620C6ED
MKLFAKITVCLSMILAIITIVIFVNPVLFITFNQNLNTTNNIISYLTLLFTLLALIIASFAFIVATKEPKLSLSILPWAAENPGPALAVSRSSKKVTITRPFSSWQLFLHNNGEVAARYPVVEIKFKNVFFGNNAFEGWRQVHHANALGWYAYQWTPEDKMIVHPHFPIELPTMNFSDYNFEVEKPEIEITIVADGFRRKTTTQKIKIIQVDFE